MGLTIKMRYQKDDESLLFNMVEYHVKEVEKYETIEYILQRGGNPDYIKHSRGRSATMTTCFFLAIIYGDIVLIDLLISYGANPVIQTKTGITPLGLAFVRVQREAIERFLSYGQDLNMFFNFEGPDETDDRGPILYHMIVNRAKYTDIIELLLKKGADPNIRLENGLKLGKITEKQPIIDLLLKYGYQAIDEEDPVGYGYT